MVNLFEIIRKAEENFKNGTTKLGKYVDFSLHETLETINAYLNSKHISGELDSLGRPKPFFNIITAVINIWYRATDIDRKNIKFKPTTNSSVPLALVASVMLQNWMDKYHFGQFLNKWGRVLSQYGSAIPKFVEKNGELIPSVVSWQRLIIDAMDFESLPVIERIYKTPAQLRAMPDLNQDMVDKLIDSLVSRKGMDGITKDNYNEFIELYEVHGELPLALLIKEPTDEDWKKYRQQMHLLSFVANDKDYEDFTIYRGKEEKSPYILTHLIEEDGRTLSIGAVEHLFNAQWMANHTVKNMKDTLDLASKLIFQTSDKDYFGRNILTDIETGDIFTHALNQPLTQINNSKPDITALQNFGTMWRNLSPEITATPEAMRGITPVSGTPLGTTELLVSQSNSLFEIMIENKGLHLEDILRIYVIPHLKKQLKNKDEVLGILDDAGIAEIDAMYVPKEAIKRFNKRTLQDVLNGNFDNVAPFNPQAEQAGVKQELGVLGNKRFFKPDELDKKQWSEVFSDFEWDNIEVEITNENTDKQAVLSILDSMFKTVVSNPMALNDPNVRMIFNGILRETAVLSPMQFSTQQPTQLPMQTPALPSGNPVGAGIK